MPGERERLGTAVKNLLEQVTQVRLIKKSKLISRLFICGSRRADVLARFPHPPPFQKV
jgi:hypothetical protein